MAERRHRPDDGRALGLLPTVKGEKLIRDLKRSVKRHDRQFVARLEPGERRELLRLLAKLSG